MLCLRKPGAYVTGRCGIIAVVRQWTQPAATGQGSCGHCRRDRGQRADRPAHRGSLVIAQPCSHCMRMLKLPLSVCVLSSQLNFEEGADEDAGSRGEAPKEVPEWACTCADFLLGSMQICGCQALKGPTVLGLRIVSGAW